MDGLAAAFQVLISGFLSFSRSVHSECKETLDTNIDQHLHVVRKPTGWQHKSLLGPGDKRRWKLARLRSTFTVSPERSSQFFIDESNTTSPKSVSNFVTMGLTWVILLNRSFYQNLTRLWSKNKILFFF